MSLRQRKSKDAKLPLYNEEIKERPQKYVPSKSSPQKPMILRWRVIYTIGCLVIAALLAYSFVNGAPKEETYEIHHHKVYHDHTAKKMHQDSRSTNSNRKQGKDSGSNTRPHDNEIKVKPATSGRFAAYTIPKLQNIRCGDEIGVLNDDYCDCSDGSDEPDTSACSHVTIRQSTFNCKDGMSTIYASRVLDGVRDCLDGSDEEG